METNVIPQFHDPSMAARYLGESVGTHYSAALRAAKAYGTHLAAKRDRLLDSTYQGEDLGAFWRELIRAEQIRIGSPKVLKGLATTPSHYFSDFLETAEAIYLRRYKDAPKVPTNGLGKCEHAQCLRFLRDHSAGGKVDHFTVQNKIAVWTQLLRMMGRYQE